MSMTLADNEVRRYLEAVRAQLVDLPEEDRDELLDDLEDHLREVAVEEDGSLEDRLGSPRVYAEELRSSAGLPSLGETRGRNLTTRVAQSRPGRLIASILVSQPSRRLRELAREIEPGWWLMRGYLAVLAPAVITSSGNQRDNVPYPHVGSYPFGLVLVVFAVLVSWRLGRLGQRHRTGMIASLVFSGAVLAAAIGALTGWSTAIEYPYGSEATYVGTATDYLHHQDGKSIANICPYSADGKLLSGVLLFDQFGRPITNTADSLEDQTIEQATPAIGNAYPKSIGIVQFGSTITIAPDGTEQQQKTVTPLQCPASVGAATAPSAPASPAP